MTRSDFAQRFDVSRETLEMLDVYVRLLEKWNRRINLVAPNSLEGVWQRHFADSAQIARFSGDGEHWVDIGSGAGFPGLVVAIFKRAHEEVRFTLVEADQRKAEFLRAVSRELELRATIVADRVEQAPDMKADRLSARALAPLNNLLAHCEMHLCPEGKAIFLKGERAEFEIREALEHWRFDCTKHQSVTNPNSTILCIGAISRA